MTTPVLGICDEPLRLLNSDPKMNIDQDEAWYVQVEVRGAPSKALAPDRKSSPA